MDIMWDPWILHHVSDNLKEEINWHTDSQETNKLNRHAILSIHGTFLRRTEQSWQQRVFILAGHSVSQFTLHSALCAAFVAFIDVCEPFVIVSSVDVWGFVSHRWAKVISCCPRFLKLVNLLNANYCDYRDIFLSTCDRHTAPRAPENTHTQQTTTSQPSQNTLPFQLILTHTSFTLSHVAFHCLCSKLASSCCCYYICFLSLLNTFFLAPLWLFVRYHISMYQIWV